LLRLSLESRNNLFQISVTRKKAGLAIMGAGASAKYKETSDADIKAALDELTGEDKAKILKELTAQSGASAENKAKITANKASLHDLESTVMGNKQKLYAERAFIEENRQMILTNYTAAFLGNRQMANQNTEDIFRNRKAIVKHYKTDGDAVKINFAESRLNEARIDYLEHRAGMNTKVAAVNAKMVEINKLLIEVNDATMANNADIVEFNTKHVDINTKLLAGELVFKNSDGSAASPEKNLERITRNASRIAQISEVAKSNGEKHAELLAAAKANREKIQANSAAIYERRAQIEKNHEAIAANASKISGWIKGE